MGSTSRELRTRTNHSWRTAPLRREPCHEHRGVPHQRRRMIMSDLTNFRVAVLATDGFEESELTEPVKALKAAGAQVTILSIKPGQIQGVRHDLDKTVKVKVERALREV